MIKVLSYYAVAVASCIQTLLNANARPDLISLLIALIAWVAMALYFLIWRAACREAQKSAHCQALHEAADFISHLQVGEGAPLPVATRQAWRVQVQRDQTL